MSWLHVSIKVPKHWHTPNHPDMPAFPNVIENICDYLAEDVQFDDDGDAIIVFAAGNARYGILSIEDDLDRLVELRVPWIVHDDGNGDELAPADWTLYDGREVVMGVDHLLHGHSAGMMSRGELVAILEGTHAWAKTPLDYFDKMPSLADCSIAHLARALHPDDEDAIDDAVAVL